MRAWKTAIGMEKQWLKDNIKDLPSHLIKEIETRFDKSWKLMIKGASVDVIKKPKSLWYQAMFGTVNVFGNKWTFDFWSLICNWMFTNKFIDKKIDKFVITDDGVREILDKFSKIFSNYSEFTEDEIILLNFLIKGLKGAVFG